MTSCNGDAVTSRSPVLDPRKNETLDVVTSKLDFQDISVNLSDLAEDGDRCQAVVNRVMNLWIP